MGYWNPRPLESPSIMVSINALLTMSISFLQSLYLKSISLPGKDGMEKMQKILSNIRKNPPREIDGQALHFDDFAQGLFGLPKSDVLRFKNENYRLIIRPSGTEPKMKIYLQAKGKNQELAVAKLQAMQALLKNFMA